MSTQPGTGTAAPEPRHLQRMTWFWVVISVIADVLFWTLAAPHMPPGTMTSSAADDQFDYNVLMMVAIPVVLGVWTFLGYTIMNWSAKRPGVPEPVGGDAARANRKSQVLWISITSVVVIGLFIFGTAALIIGNGSGGGEGPNPVWPIGSKNPLQVQVIGQQWKWTYRYPQFGGFETPDLMLPNNTTVVFHVTSLDVIHDFWAYQLAVKADANPMQDNVAYTHTSQLGAITVRCNELCGVWHGAMYDFGKVVTPQAFETWAKKTELANAANTKLLPPFAYTYVPDANGADGGFYPTTDPYSAPEVYGAKVAAS